MSSVREVPKVVDLWHKYYDGLANPPANQNYEVRDRIYVQMLSAMAECLGFRKLEQTKIDKFYSPIAHGNQLELNYKCQAEWLRVLENTAKLEVTLKSAAPPLPSKAED